MQASAMLDGIQPLTFIPAVQYNALDGLMERGSIRCNKCKAAMSGDRCPRCGHTRCYIEVYWRGKSHHRRNTAQGETLTFKEAALILIEINKEWVRHGKRFDLTHYLDRAVTERSFGRRWAEYLQYQADRLTREKIGSEHYRHIVAYGKCFLAFMADKDILDVDLSLLDDFDKTLAVRSKTRRNVYNVLHSFFVWLHDRGKLKDIPPLPKIEGGDETPRKALRSADQDEAIGNIPEEHRDPIAFMRWTGVRPGEVVAILVKSVDLVNRCVWIERAKSGNQEKERTKNKSKLPVPLNQSALSLAKRNSEGKFPMDHLFIHPGTRMPYTTWFLWDLWKRSSGTDVTLYEATRHSFCSNLPRLTDRRLAQRLMRHKDSRSTDRYYHEWSEDLLDVVDRMDNVVPLRKSDEETT